MRRLLKATTAWVTAAALLNPFSAGSAFAIIVTGNPEPTITLATSAGTAGAAQARDPAAQSPLSVQDKIALLRQKVKYVFVLFQENRSFDHYFGTYPGANGLFATYPGALGDPIQYSQPANTFGSYNSVIREPRRQLHHDIAVSDPAHDPERQRSDRAAVSRGHLLGRSQPHRLHSMTSMPTRRPNRCR